MALVEETRQLVKRASSRYDPLRVLKVLMLGRVYKISRERFIPVRPAEGIESCTGGSALNCAIATLHPGTTR